MITTITEREFKQWFPGREHLWELLNTRPKTEGELIENYLPSKLWRLNNLYTIIDKYGDSCQFRMNRAQFYVYSHLYKHPRLVILKSRQQGISTLFLVSYSDDSVFYSHLNCGLMAQDREAASLLLERTKYLWDRFPLAVKAFLGRRLVQDNASTLKFNNFSSLFIRTSFRSATLQRLHISELGKIANKYPDRAKEVKTGTLQALAAGNPGIIESTAEGANMFKAIWDDAVQHQAEGKELAPKDFLPVFLPWLDDPDCVEFTQQDIDHDARDYFAQLEHDLGRPLTPQQKNFWVMQERELLGDIHQEYPTTPSEAFSASKDGTYWSKLYLQYVVRLRRVVTGLYDRNLPVYCVMDLGRNDYTVMTFFQVYGNSIRFIHCYYNQGECLGHYAEKLKELKAEYGWDVEEVGLPHDCMVVDLSEEQGRTRKEILEDRGVDCCIVLDKQSVHSGIELVREALPHIWIAAAPESAREDPCEYLRECFLYYTKKWNKEREIWNTEPQKNIYSHGADTLRYAIQYCHDYLHFDFSNRPKLKNSGRHGSYRNGSVCV